MANISDTIVAYKIIKDLGTKWVEFQAYELGLIDENGEKKRSPETSIEREAYSSYFKIIFNLKRILQRFVGKNPSVNKIASLFLMKEGYSKDTVDFVIEKLDLPTDTADINESMATLLLEEYSIKD